jgi:hypothetical protein
VDIEQKVVQRKVIGSSLPVGCTGHKARAAQAARYIL